MKSSTLITMLGLTNIHILSTNPLHVGQLISHILRRRVFLATIPEKTVFTEGALFLATPCMYFLAKPVKFLIFSMPRETFPILR